MQIEQLAAAARWVFGLGMRQLMAAWVLGSKMGFSCVGVDSGVMVWAVASSWHHGVMGLSLSLSCSHLSLSFLFFFSFFPSFLAFPFGFGVLLTTRFSSSSFLFYTHTHTHTNIYIYLRFSLALENSWVGRLG